MATLELTAEEINFVRDIIGAVHAPGQQTPIERQIVNKINALIAPRSEQRSCQCLVRGAGGRYCYATMVAPMSVTLCSDCQADNHQHGQR